MRFIYDCLWAWKVALLLGLGFLTRVALTGSQLLRVSSALSLWSLTSLQQADLDMFSADHEGARERSPKSLSYSQSPLNHLIQGSKLQASLSFISDHKVKELWCLKPLSLHLSLYCTFCQNVFKRSERVTGGERIFFGKETWIQVIVGLLILTTLGYFPSENR